MIDLHCHLHHACDDGPQTASEALALAKALVDVGVTKVACTPHIRSDKGWMNTATEQPKLLASTRALLKSNDVPLEVVQGAEHYVDETLFAQAFDGHVVPYADTKWLLVELPYQGEPPGLFDLLYRIRTAGYRILLAHLERFPYVAEDAAKVERLLDAGALVQVNLGSLAGAYTRAHKKLAHKLVKAGYVSVACGDCHQAADVKRFTEKGLKALRKISADLVQPLTVDHPAAILADEEPQKIWP